MGTPTKTRKERTGKDCAGCNLRGFWRIVVLVLGGLAGLGTLPANPASGDAGNPAILILGTPPATPRLVRVLSWEKFQGMVFYSEVAGSRTGIPESQLVSAVPVPGGEVTVWNDGDLSAVQTSLQSLRLRYPALAADVDVALTPIRGEIQKRLAAQESRKVTEAQASALSEEVDALIKEPFDPALGVPEIKTRLAAASALAVRAGTRAGEIEAWTQPWKEQLAKLEAAQDGGALADKAEGPAQAGPLAESILRINATPVSGLVMVCVLGGLALVLLLIVQRVLSHAFRLFPGKEVVLSSKQGRLDAVGSPRPPGLVSHLVALSLVGALAATGYVVWHLSMGGKSIETFRAEHGLSEARESTLLQSLLAQTAGTDSAGDLTLPVPDADLFLQTHVRFEPTASALLPQLALTRRALAAAQKTSGVVLAEEVRFMSLPILIEYRIPMAVEGQSGAQKMAITANGLPVPGRFAAYLWSSISSQLRTAYQASSLGGAYMVSSLQIDGLRLRKSSAAAQVSQ